MSVQVTKTYEGQPGSNGVNHLIAAVAGKAIFVLSYTLQALGTVNATFQDTSGSPVQLSPPWNLGATAPAVPGITRTAPRGTYVFVTTVGQGLDLLLSAAVGVNVELEYVLG